MAVVLALFTSLVLPHEATMYKYLRIEADYSEHYIKPEDRILKDTYKTIDRHGGVHVCREYYDKKRDEYYVLTEILQEKEE